MMNHLSALLFLLLAGLVSSCTTLEQGGGGTVEVNFESPDQFTDMDRSYSAARGADEGYMDQLREYIQRTGASRIPAGYTLSVTITDVDMAGQFEPERGPQFMDVRIVKTIYPPRIRLNHRLTDASGAVRSEGERRLTNQSFEYDLSPIDRSDPLRHEKALIDDFLGDVAREAR